MVEQVIEANNVSKKYSDVTALKNVNISIARGDIYGLVGDNGAGKSTFLKLLTGQIFLTDGEIRLLGEHIPGNIEKQRRRTGAIIESPGFYPNLTVEKNLEYYRIQKGVPGKRIVEKTLDTVGLLDKKNKRCTDLSMGMKQRLGLAVALLGEPEILILDEPINGLDPSGIIEIRNLFLNLNREKRITIIISSHMLRELQQIASVYGFLSKGKLLKQISIEELTEQCSSYVEITTSNPEKYSSLLEKELGHSQYSVMPDKSIRIINPRIGVEQISNLASKHNITITKLDKIQVSLEDYYMNLKNGGNA